MLPLTQNSGRKLKNMVRVLVVFHLYYEDQLEYFLSKMKNISGCVWDLLVTGPELNQSSRTRILEFKPDASFLVTSNVGYDVWPFIEAVKKTDLSRYDFIMKLHTKNSNQEVSLVNGLRMKGFRWRDMLVEALIGSPSRFVKTLGMFDDPSIGIVFCSSFYKNVSAGLYEDLKPLEEELDRLGIDSGDLRFCAGTMFLARTSPYRILQDAQIGENMFSAGLTHGKGSMAHIYERILTILVASAGYRIGEISVDGGRESFVKVHKMLSPVLSWIFSLSRKGEESHKYLTVFGMDFKIAD